MKHYFLPTGTSWPQFGSLLLLAALLVSGGPAWAAQASKHHGKKTSAGHGAAAKGDAKAPASKNPEVTLETNKGKVVVRLFADKAPLSVANFLAYADEGFYEGTIFHRVIPDFMVQGGGFTKDLQKKPTHDAIKNEADNGLANVRGTLAMARTNEIDSATSQFFINVKDNRQLDKSVSNFGYAVFGEVISGMDVVDAIRQVPCLCPSYTGETECMEPLPPGMRDVPKEPVVVQKVSRRGGDKAAAKSTHHAAKP